MLEQTLLGEMYYSKLFKFEVSIGSHRNVRSLSTKARTHYPYPENRLDQLSRTRFTRGIVYIGQNREKLIAYSPTPFPPFNLRVSFSAFRRKYLGKRTKSTSFSRTLACLSFGHSNGGLMKKILLLVFALLLLAAPAASMTVTRSQAAKSLQEQDAPSQEMWPRLPRGEFIALHGSALRFIEGSSKDDVTYSSGNQPGRSALVWDSAFAAASVKLPHKARITYFAAAIRDNKPGVQGWVRLRKNLVTKSVILAETKSPDNFKLKETRRIFKGTVGNRRGGYYVEAKGVPGNTGLMRIDYIVIGYVE